MTTQAPLLITTAVLLSLALVAPAAAQHEILFITYNDAYRITEPPRSGPLTSNRIADIGLIWAWTTLSDGSLVGYGNRSMWQIDPVSFDATPLVGVGFNCNAIGADHLDNVWCTNSNAQSIRRLEAGTYQSTLYAEHPDLFITGVASFEGQVYASARRIGFAEIGLYEVDQETGDLTLLNIYETPPSPEQYFNFVVSGIDFDDAGDLLISLPLVNPAVILPLPSQGYFAWLVDPFGDGQLLTPQAAPGTGYVRGIALGAPTSPTAPVDVPTSGTAGLALLAAALMLIAVARMRHI